MTEVSISSGEWYPVWSWEEVEDWHRGYAHIAVVDVEETTLTRWTAAMVAFDELQKELHETYKAGIA